MNKKIAIGIVCYHSDSVFLDLIVKSFDDADVLLFDNDAGLDLRALFPTTTILGTGINRGLGVACNMLMQHAIQHQYDFLILSDQDTIYPRDYAGKMAHAFCHSETIVAIFPAWKDANIENSLEKAQYVAEQGSLRLRKITTMREISHGIMSGMTIALAKIPAELRFDEDLFIDWVDSEWCWRAKEVFGLNCYYNPLVTLTHKLGDKSLRFFNNRFTVRSADRNYYIIRNAVYLLLHKQLGFIYKRYILMKLFHHSIFSLFVGEAFMGNFLAVLRGHLDGILSRMGKRQHSDS